MVIYVLCMYQVCFMYVLSVNGIKTGIKDLPNGKCRNKQLKK